MGLELINLRFKCNKAFAESCYSQRYRVKNTLIRF